MKIKVSREFVIKAIEEERHLAAGSWVRLTPTFKTLPILVGDPACQVCAVGAVMRRVLEPSRPYYAIEHAAYTAVEAIGLTEETDSLAWARARVAGHPMSALSGYFEALMTTVTTTKRKAEVRALVVAFVRERFPEHVEIDLGDEPPRAGIEEARA